MKKVILFIAVSLDGYIAHKNGGVGWLSGEEENYIGDYGYGEFIADIDTVIMGHTTYRQIVEDLSPERWLYQGMTTYVLTHNSIPPNTGEIKFTSEPVRDLIQRLINRSGKNIWICGGADVVRQFMEQDLIDVFHITIMPTLLGSGIRLFSTAKEEQLLRLSSVRSENGAIDCIYRKR